jgi:hypothetical protein
MVHSSVACLLRQAGRLRQGWKAGAAGRNLAENGGFRAASLAGIAASGDQRWSLDPAMLPKTDA